MQRKRNGFLFLFLGVILIIVAFAVFYYYRLNQKKSFDALFNKDYYLRVNYGALDNKRSKLKDKDIFFKEKDVDKNYYLYITKDNILYTYYQDDYYKFDPMKGYIVEYKIELDSDITNQILNEVKNKMINDIYIQNKNEYITIRINNENAYINKKDFQLILQKNNIVLSL